MKRKLTCRDWLRIVGATGASVYLAGSVLAQEITYRLDTNIAYLPDNVMAASEYAKEKCRLDLYRPVGLTGFPTVVYYHGGGLTAGSRSIPVALKERGWAVAGVSYRLHPKVQHPVYIEDAAAALAWVFKNIESHGGDVNKIFVTGISAGGYLTAMVGLDKSYLAKHEIDANRIAALIPVTGQMITHQTVRKEQGIEPSKFRPTIDRFAPLYHVRNDAPPTLCITGGWGVDMLMRAEENLYFVSMMKLVGHKNIRHVVIEGANHSRCGKECWPHVIEFIEKTLAGSPLTGNDTVRSECAKTTIVVDLGTFTSPLEAASAEDKVNWMDADLSDDNACTECFAALELQRYLRKMTGRADDFAVAQREPAAGDMIRVGGTTIPDVGPEGYRIQSCVVNGRRVTTLSGGGRVGTLYAAYDLLYRLGCRWFAPGELHEEVPRITGIPDMDVTEKPAFRSRGFLAWENRGDPEFLLWMARNRMNYWTLAQQEHGLMRKLGIRMVYGGHNAQQAFLNPDRYFAAHPKWFPLVKGKRIPGIKGSFGTNYCTSNAEATSEFAKNYVQALIDGEAREADIIRFWFLDAGKWCECDNCKAQGTPTDRNLFVTHRFAEEVKNARQAGRIHRPIAITFLAYADVVEPPSKPLPAGFDYETCAATFYPIRRCYVHNFDDPGCEVNSRYFRQLNGWSSDPQRHYRGQIAIGEYYNVSRFKSLPICFMHTMANDIPCYYRMGARHFDYMHVTCRNWGTKALTNYQMARQLWDVQTDCEALWRDYFAKRYGAAASTMRAFYESLERMLCNATELKYGLATRLQRGETNLFPNAHLTSLGGILEHSTQCRRLLTEAIAMQLPARIKERIAEDERNFTYGERTVAYYDACVQAFTEARAGRLDAARQHYLEARRLADLLRADTVSTKDSSSHANAENALEASGAAGALHQIAKLLAPRNDVIPAFLSLVSEDNLRRWVFHIAKDPLPFRKANYTRLGQPRSTLDETDDWIEEHLRKFGYEVEREACQVQAYGYDPTKPRHRTWARPPPGAPFYKVHNLYAKKTGKGRPKEIILLVAHKDSQSWIDSPGAYDNAVGTVANLEIARLLARYKSDRSIWFLWCNEEHTPWTSLTAASNCWQRGDNLIAIFNTDSIGGKSHEDIAAGRKTNVTLYTKPEGKRLADLMAEVNDAYKIGLVQSSQQRKQPGDDDGSFVKAGYSCAIANLGSYPYADPNYHEPGDIPERVDIVNVRMTTQAILAAVLRLDRAP